MHAFGRPLEGRLCVWGSWPCSAQHFYIYFFWKRMNYNGCWIPFPHVLYYRDFYLFVRWEVSATTVEIRCVCVVVLQTTGVQDVALGIVQFPGASQEHDGHGRAQQTHAHLVPLRWVQALPEPRQRAHRRGKDWLPHHQVGGVCCNLFRAQSHLVRMGVNAWTCSWHSFCFLF